MFYTTNIMPFPLEDPQKKRGQGKIPIPEAEVNTLVENKREMRFGIDSFYWNHTHFKSQLAVE